MNVSICIVTRSQPTLLRECVASCVEEIKRSNIVAEIVLIDNASVDRYPQQVAELFPGTQVIRSEENLGFSAANNKAIRASRGRLVLFLNDDAVLQENSLALMLEIMDSSARIGAVGPRLLELDGSLQTGFTNRRFPHLRGLLCQTLRLEKIFEKNALTRDVLTMSKDPERAGETDHLAGACLLARRAALDAIGVFDEGFRFWFEDVDLCYRLKIAGWQIVYAAQARVTHYGSASLDQLSPSERNAIYFNSLKYYCRKYSSPAYCLLLRLTLALAVFVRMCGAILYKPWRGGSSRTERRDSVQRTMSIVRSLLWGPD